ncbi:cytochrome c [Sulfurimonas sp.]|uniref:c-type cytochrome n=1 Tax=Sulfurimonas sp. TaxID=2022749 RepID=UPI00356561AB
MKIILSIVLAFLFLGCGEDGKKEVQQAQPKQVVKEASEVKKTPSTEVVEAPKEVVVKQEEVKVDGKTIFNVCSACHGQNAEKSALGKSKIIKGWDAGKIADALKGYKEGTYGGVMKSVMVGQASKLDDEKIKAVSDYISKL